MDIYAPSATHTPKNPAVRRCCLAEKRSRRDSRMKRLDTIETTIRADDAYRKAMPELVGHENIRDFIACAGHGLVIGSLTFLQATKLLYAAQVALSALRHQSLPGKSQAQVPLPPPRPEKQTKSVT